MKYSVILASLAASLLSAPDLTHENRCRARRVRCEQRCVELRKIGSMRHLRCNERCRERYLNCRNAQP